jgi:tetratricopeptide (TPR) repeat protein
MRRSLPILTAFALLGAAMTVHATSGLDILDVRAGDSVNAGAKLADKGDYAGAIKYYDAAIRTQPDLWVAYYERARVLMLQKKWAAALQDLNTTIRLQPAFFEASWVRAHLHLKMHNYGGCLTDLNALDSVTRQVQNAGELGLVLNSRSWLRATCPDAAIRNGQAAVNDGKKACELARWKNSSFTDTLAAAYAEAGDFDSAVRYEEQAIALRQSEGPEPVKPKDNSDAARRDAEKRNAENARAAHKALEGCLSRLQLYKQHRPYRETPG